MARAQFSETVIAAIGPSGTEIPLAGVAATVFNVNPDGSEGSAASAYAARTGATAATLATDASGTVTFWLDIGEYNIHMDDQNLPPRISSYVRAFSPQPRHASTHAPAGTDALSGIMGSQLDPAAGITFGQLALGAGKLKSRGVTGVATALSGQLIVAQNGTSYAVTLPPVSANALIGFTTYGSGSGVISPTVDGGAGEKIFGLGVSGGATAVQMGTAGDFLLLHCDGSNWFIISGEIDSGWLAVTPASGVTGSADLAAKIVGNRVLFRGTLSRPTSVGSGGTAIWATLPSSIMRPSINRPFVNIPTDGGTPPVLRANSASSDLTQNGGLSADNVTIILEGASYDLE